VVTLQKKELALRVAVYIIQPASTAQSVIPTQPDRVETQAHQEHLVRRSVVLSIFLPPVLVFAALTGCSSGNSSNSGSTSNNPGVPAPAITSISPATVNAGAAAQTIAVSGTGFVSGSVVTFNGTSLQTTYGSATSLQGSIPAALIANGQTASITVTNASAGGGTSTITSYPVNAPTPQISSITPSALLQSSTGTLLVSGSGFEANSSVQWNGSARATTFVNANTLQVFVAAADTATVGTGQVTVNNPGPGGSTTPSASEVIYPVPAINSLSPSTIPTGSAATLLTVTGANFASGSTIVLDGTSLVTTYVSATSLQASLAASLLTAARTANITVHNPDPQAADSTAVPLAITSPSPVLTSISPATVATGAGATISLTGTGFVANSSALWNGSPRTTTYQSAAVLRVALTAGDLATAGTGQITVTNPAPGGGSSSAQTLNMVTPPSITSVNPSTIQETSSSSTTPTPITINGSNFASNATASVNGYQLAITNQSSTQITGTIPVYATSYTTGPVKVYVYTALTGSSVIASQPATLNIINPSATFTPNPAGAQVGSPDTKITINGSGFFPDSVVQWNGISLATTYVGTTSLTATIPASYLALPGSGVLHINTPENLGQTSPNTAFSIYLSLPVNDLAWNAVDGLIYATVPSSAGTPYGNSLAGIDPTTGVVKKFVFVGSEPNRLALSTDGTQAFIGLDGAGAVRQVNLTTMTAGVQFGLGGGTGVYNPPYTASSLAAVPSQPNSVAIYGTNGVVTIFDSGVARAKTSSGLNTYFSSNYGGLSFGSSASTLYVSSEAIGSYIYALTVDSTGIAASRQISTSGAGRTLQYDNGRLYFPNGTIADASTGNSVGQFSAPGSSPAVSANGLIVSDSALNRAWMVEGNYSSSNMVVAYDETTFTPAASLSVTVPSGVGSNNYGLIRWGQNGLAFPAGKQLYIVQGPIVKDLSATPVDVKVTATIPASVTTGTSFATQFQVANSGPNSAQGVSFAVTVPAQLTYGSVASSAGSCSGTATVYCNLGTLASGASATITLNTVPLSTGSLQLTGTASTQSYDSDGTNNQATSSTVATGSVFSPVPAITAISPNMVASGSSTFTLTVTGTGFTSASAINWNGSSLSTTLVSGTSLTASVDSSLVTQLGWAAITVSSASPGGGVSGSRAFSIYSLLNVPANAMVYDPYTRKLWVVLPSTSTTPAGNSIVPVDPSAATIGTPILIGSEPNVMAETGSGNYIYVGLSGAKSMGRFNMKTQTLDLTVPLTTSGFQPGPVAATQIATIPGLDNTVAVSNVGIFDISGSTATARPNSTLGYNNAVFPDSGHVYTFDDYSTGAEFYRYTVDSGGVHLLDGTTLNGMGGFSGSFALDGGLGFGGAGGIFNPSTAVPQMVGTLPLGEGPYGTGLFGGGVVPYQAENKAFVTGVNAAGTWLVFLERFDTRHFLYEDQIQFPTTGVVQQTAGSRWSQDGLAFILNSGLGGTAPSQIMIMRGPFVLPSELAANSAPVLSSVGAGSLSVGSGNQTITVKGTSFLPGASVVWNGVVHDTTYVDANTLTVAVGAAEVNAAATLSVTCRNPGSGDSNAISVTIH
jgi:trimeric autotransporter adhesin